MSSRLPHRRDFLTGRAAADAAGHWLGLDDVNPPPSASPVAPCPEEPYVVHLSREAMACQFEVILNAGQYERGAEAGLAALDLVDQLEDQLSVYRESSELSAINRTAHDAAVSIEPRLFALLEQAAELHAETHGAFDITAGPLTRAWGFFRRAGGIPTPEALAEARQRVGMQHVRFDPAACSVQLARPGMEFNLGSIGKGYALDRAAEFLEAREVRNFLLHGGQSSVLARGTGTATELDGWIVGLRDPLRPERRLAEIRLLNQALGTSGNAVQFFRHDGKRYGHIIDPRTGWPAEGIFSATALAPTAAWADALATAFYVLGVDVTREFCARHPEIGAVLTFPSETGAKVEIAVIGLPESRWRPLE